MPSPSRLIHSLASQAAALCLSLSAFAATPPWLERFDGALLDFEPAVVERVDASARRLLRRLNDGEKEESDRKVLQDLDILIDAVRYVSRHDYTKELPAAMPHGLIF